MNSIHCASSRGSPAAECLPTHTVPSPCAEAQRLHPINGIRTRVYGPPRASCSESRASGMLTQLRGPGDLNSEGGSSSSTYTRDLEEKHKILINRRTSR